MRGSTRLIVYFGTGAILVVVVAIALVFALGKSPALLPADTPEGTVQRYLLASQRNDLTGANQYLTPQLQIQNSPPVKTLPPGAPYPPPYRIGPYDYFGGNAWKATIRDSTTNSFSATVKVAFEISTNGGSFAPATYTNYIEYSLSRQGGAWIISGEAFSGP